MLIFPLSVRQQILLSITVEVIIVMGLVGLIKAMIISNLIPLAMEITDQYMVLHMTGRMVDGFGMIVALLGSKLPPLFIKITPDGRATPSQLRKVENYGATDLTQSRLMHTLCL